MKILVHSKKHPSRCYLVEVLTESQIKEVIDHVNNRRHSQAIMAAFANGSVVREVHEGNSHKVDADLILTDKNVRWNLC